MTSKQVLASMSLLTSAVAVNAYAAQSEDFYVDRHEIDDYHGLIYTPIVSRFNAGEVKFKLTVPIVRFTSAAAAGFYTDDALTLARHGATATYAEIGDITVKASKRVWRSKLSGLSLNAGTKVEFATGDVDKDIGYGRTEVAMLLDARQPVRAFELLAGVSYAVRHSFTDDPALNGFTGYVGLAYRVAPRTYLDTTYEYSQASELGDPAERKLSVALNHGADSSWMLRSYVSITQEGREREQELGFSLSKHW